MQTQHGRIGTKLEPATEQLNKVGVMPVVGHKATNVGSPPWNAGQTHVYATLQLVAQRLKGARHVTTPYYVAILLATSPAGAQQVDGLVPSVVDLSLPHRAAVPLRIDVGARERRPQLITVVVKVVHAKVRLCVIEPEHVDAIVRIVGLEFFPQEGAGLGIGTVDL